MIDFELEVERESFLAELDELEMEITRKLLMTMEQVGWEVVSFLRSIGHGTVPPARPGEPSRSAHPGGWSDVTSNLANAYRFELSSGGQIVRWVREERRVPEGQRGTVKPVVVQGSLPARPRWPLELMFLNGMEYAAALEAKDGYWVVREITEAGGPVRRAMETVLRRVAPGVKIRMAG